MFIRVLVTKQQRKFFKLYIVALTQAEDYKVLKLFRLRSMRQKTMSEEVGGVYLHFPCRAH